MTVRRMDRNPEGRTERSRSPKTSEETTGVRVWGEVGVTLSVTSDPPQFIRVLFGHERLSAGTGVQAIRDTARLVDEYNEKELERQIRKYKRLMQRVVEDDEDDESPRARARRRLRSQR